MFRKFVYPSAVGLMLLIAAGAQAQNVLFEYWMDCGGGTAVSDLTSLGSYPWGPTSSEYREDLKSKVDWADNYGERARAYLVPPQSGDYTFWVSGDDGCQLWLSTDDTAENAKMIAQVTGWTPVETWDWEAGQKSAPIALEGGKSYFIQMLHKEGGGGDSVTAAWAGPGIGDGPTVIGGANLAKFVETRHPAFSPVPASGSVDVTNPLFQWTAGTTAVMHDVYFGTNPTPGAAEFKGRQPFAMYFEVMPLVPGATYYWRVDEIEADGVTTHTGDVWTFTVMPDKAYRLSPYDGAIRRGLDTKLGWSAGNMAESHDVYLGADQAAVAAGDASVLMGNQADTGFDPNGLAAGTTYYWRVDEIRGAEKIVGDVLSFTTAAEGNHGARYELYSDIGGGTTVADLTSSAKFPGSPDEVSVVANFEAPSDFADSYGARMTAWLNVPAAAEYTFWVASDDASKLYVGTSPANAEQIAEVTGWAPSRGWDQEAGAKSKPIQLEAGKYFLMALMKEGGGGDNLSAAWQGGPIKERELILGGFLEPFVPLWAEAPKPANGAKDTEQSQVLSWTAGVKATAHDVYFGTDKDAVAAGDASVFKGQVTETTFDVGALEWGTTYYWRVDEVGEGGPWAGVVWSFTTADALVIKLSNTAVDYDNFFDPFLSEVALDVPADWTVNGVTDLELQFQGAGAPTGSVSFDEATGTYTVTGEGADVWGTSDQFQYAYKMLDGDGEILARVVSNGTGSNTWAKGGVMIRGSLAANATQMLMGMTGGDGGGIAFQGRQTAGGNSSSFHGDVTAAPPYWVKLTRKGNSITGYYSADGVEWQPMPDTTPDNSGFPMSNPVDVPMDQKVYIGLFVTSHAAGELRTYTFDNVSSTGNLVPAGPFTLSKAVGLPGNSAQPVFVVAEDSAGAMAPVSYPDAAASQIASLRNWKIPLSDFVGVDLKSMAKLHLGVGDVAAPAPDGTGTVTFSGIRIVKPPLVPADVTAPGDPVQGIPTGLPCGGDPAANYTPCGELPPLVIDNKSATKYLNFGGNFGPDESPSGFQVTPSLGSTIVTGLTFTTANDAAERDPTAFELYGSNESIDGPWTLIASGEIVDFAGATPWPRFTMNATPITFENTVAYKHYQVLFTAIRNAATANSMQIAEVELIGLPAK